VYAIERSLRSRARSELRDLRARRSEAWKDRRFRELVDAYTAFEERWEGTDAAQEASEGRISIESIWDRGAEFAWNLTHQLCTAGKLGQAFAALTALKKWCPDHVRASVDEKMQELLTADDSDAEHAERRKFSRDAWKQQQEAINRELARLEREDQKKREERRARNEVPWLDDALVVLKLEVKRRITGTVEPDPVRRTLLAQELVKADPQFRIVPAGSDEERYDYLVRVVTDAKYVGKNQFHDSVTISHVWQGEANLEVVAPGAETILHRVKGVRVKETYREREEGREGILTEAMTRFLEMLRRTPGWRLAPRQR
jgi:hypothetical protein